MEALTFKANSWHGRLAFYYGPLHEDLVAFHGTDICTYTKAVLLGSFKVLLITTVCGALAGTLGDTLAWLISGLIYGFQDPDLAAKAFLGISGAVCAGAAYLAFNIYKWKIWRYFFPLNRETYEKSLVEPKAPSFLKQAYLSWKEKYCVPVKIQ